MLFSFLLRVSCKTIFFCFFFCSNQFICFCVCDLFETEYFPSMGRALVYTVEELLGKEAFTRQIKDAWVEVYGALSYDMIRAQKQGKIRM